MGDMDGLFTHNTDQKSNGKKKQKGQEKSRSKRGQIFFVPKKIQKKVINRPKCNYKRQGNEDRREE